MTTHPFFPVTLDDRMRALRADAEKLIAQANACADLAGVTFVMAGTGTQRAEVERRMAVEAVKLKRFQLLGLGDRYVIRVAVMHL